MVQLGFLPHAMRMQERPCVHKILHAYVERILCMHKLKNKYTYARIDLYTHESSLHKRRKDHAHA